MVPPGRVLGELASEGEGPKEVPGGLCPLPSLDTPCLTAVSYRCISGECVRVRLWPQALLHQAELPCHMSSLFTPVCSDILRSPPVDCQIPEGQGHLYSLLNC